MSRWFLIILSVLFVYANLRADEQAPATKPAVKPQPIQPKPLEPATTQTATRAVSKRMHQFYREGYRPPQASDQSEKDLQKMIDRLNAMVLPAERQKPKPEPKKVEVKKPTPTTQPVKTQTLAKTKTDKTISIEVLKRLRKQMPKKVLNPIRLADALFTAGHKEEAYAFYKKCLDDADNDTDRAWLVYQIGQCRIESNPIEARVMFTRLISEFPNSRWTPLAEIQRKLIDSLIEHKPDEILRRANEIAAKNEKR